MHWAYRGDDCCVIDDFLVEDAWTELWTHFQFCELNSVTRSSGAWKLDDGVPLAGNEILTPGREEVLSEVGAVPHRFPTGTPMDQIFQHLLPIAEELSDWVGDEWDKIAARPYVYPAATALSWHGDDHELFTGAFVYYAHPVWNAHWGGELLIAETEEDADTPMMAYRFETENYSESLLELGMGRFIMPKPNRLIVLGKQPHMVCPVRAAAGHNVRATVAGFFLRQQSQLVEELRTEVAGRKAVRLS